MSATAERFITGFRAGSYDKLLTGPGAVFVNYRLPDQQLLGFTDGGSEFNPGITYRDVTGDLRFGMVRGGRILDDVQPTLTVNLKEWDVNNMLKTFPGMAATERYGVTLVEDEAVGTGDDSQVLFPLANETVEFSSLRLYADGELIRDNLYFLYNVGDAGNTSGTAAEIVFGAPVPTGTVITATYLAENAAGGAVEYSELSIGNVDQNSYFDNVAVIATISGSQNPFVGILRNAIVSEPPTFSLSNKDETTSSVTFSGMMSPSDMEDVALGRKTIREASPFRIYFPEITRWDS